MPLNCTLGGQFFSIWSSQSLQQGMCCPIGFSRSIETCLSEYAAVLTRESDAPLPEALAEAVKALKQAQTGLKKSLTITF